MLSRLVVSIITLISLFGLLLSPVIGASFPTQATTGEDEDIPDIIIEGPVQAINVNIITIANIDIEVSSDNPVLTTIAVGTVVRIAANAEADDNDLSIFIAQTVTITNTNIITPIITITGPVQAVNVNIITIYNIDIQFNPNDPLLIELNIGDVIEVSGNLMDAAGTIIIIPIQVVIIVNIDATPDPAVTPEVNPETTPEPTTDDGAVTIVIEGPVDAINVNVITIFDIDIEINQDDPILTQIEIGDVVRVEGNPIAAGNRIIIVAITIIIVEIDYIIIDAPTNGPIPSGCKVTKKGKLKCSKKSSKKSSNKKSS